MNWLQHGHGLNDLVDATPNPNLDLAKFADRCQPGGYGGTYGKYTNDEGEKGPFTVMRATAQSVNGVFLNMGKELDQCDTRDNAIAFGVHQGHTDTSDPSGFLQLQHQPSAILGTNSVAPLTMAAAYAGIANGGVFCTPVAVDAVISPEGQKLPGQPKNCSSALDPGIDAAVGVAMQGVFSGGTAGAARPAGVAILGKTGTTNKSLETWTVGSTTRVSTAVWVGNATGQVPTRITRPPVHCPGTANQVATLRNCVFKHTMEAIDAAYPPGKFPPAPAQYLSGTTVALADYSGQTVTAATAQLQALGFNVNVVAGEIASAQPEGTVAYTDPGPGGKYAPGYLINIYVSDGSQSKTVPNVTGFPFPTAKAAIAAAGFTTDAVQGCVVVTDPLKVDKAVSTNPVQGWQGPAATKVTVEIGKLGSCP
jgi:membrane peptidoglycan carboxypeptidase